MNKNLLLEILIIIALSIIAVVLIMNTKHEIHIVGVIMAIVGSLSFALRFLFKRNGKIKKGDDNENNNHED